jgi:hypothetical protein
MAEMLEEKSVEAEEPAHRLAAQRALGASLHGVPPLLGHPLGAA